MRAPEFPVLTTDRLKLDELKAHDQQAIFALFSDPEVTAHYDVETFQKPAEAERLIDYFSSSFTNNTGIRWAIRKRGEDKLIGTCGLNNWNQYDASVTLGYDLIPEHWGKGYASEAVKAVIAFVFSIRFPIKVNRIESIILPSNAASIALTEKMGFQLEGVLRDKSYWDGEFHDMKLFSLLKRDYLALMKKP